MKLDGRVDYLYQEIARGYCYPHYASFCLWLLDTDIYKKLDMVQLDRLTEYVVENEHQEENVPEDHWEHIIHVELKQSCLVCTVKEDMVADYKLYGEERNLILAAGGV